jgi:hypothetical protein
LRSADLPPPIRHNHVIGSGNKKRQPKQGLALLCPDLQRQYAQVAGTYR